MGAEASEAPNGHAAADDVGEERHAEGGQIPQHGRPTVTVSPVTTSARTGRRSPTPEALSGRP